MKITILNGNPDPNKQDFEGYLGKLENTLGSKGHQVTHLHLREMDLRHCTGCFGCWVKTPGECVTRDEGARLRQAVILSDFTLWASPLRMGFPSALLKKAMDKSIPLIHPYFTVDQGEAHHRARYTHYPRLGLLLEKEADTGEADLRITADIFSRTALNLKSRLEFCLSTDQPVEEVARAISAPQGRAPGFEKQPSPTAGQQVAPPLRLTVFNGSPRGRKGNTPLMLEHFIKGFTSLPGRSYEMFHLSHTHDAADFQQAFGQAECALLGFPLYTDAMPGIVKAFIESLEIYKGRDPNPPLGFLVQSGFPEAVHSRHVEHYLEKLAGRLGSPYFGTIVKGGGEGVRLVPEKMNRKLFSALFQAGKTFAETGRLDPAILRSLARPERYPAALAPVFKLFVRTPLASVYWDSQLKENGVFEQRFARPYSRTKTDSA